MMWQPRMVAVGVLAVMGVGCTEVQYTIRQADSHREGSFFTMQTSAERVTRLGPFYESVEPEGINYWRCSKVEGQMSCTKVCEDLGARVCAPALIGRFGQVNPPPQWAAAGSSPALYDGASESDLPAEEIPAEEMPEGEGDAVPQADEPAEEVQ